jgi:hypothetical protein
MIREHIADAFKKCGIEGTEDVILTSLSAHPGLQARFLEVYHQIIEDYMGR